MNRILKYSLLSIAFLLLVLFIIRAVTPSEIDDIHPNRICEKKYIEKSDILWVMPKYLNISMSSNKTWCNYIKSLNKTIGMHGITHSYHEMLEENYSIEDFQSALEEFKKCFGEYPTMFKSPYIKSSKHNRNIIKSLGLEMRNEFDQTIHKVYHCNNAGNLPNWWHDLF